MADVKTACRDLNELSPKAQKACRLFLDRCKKQGLNIGISETYRSQARQDYLYSLGRTKSGNIVTWTKNSRHTSRRAWDIYHNKKGDEYNTSVLKRAGEIAITLGITWGGTWSTPDMPHFEINENWNYEEDEPMTAEEKAKVQAIDDSLTNLYAIVQNVVDKQRVYNSIDELPEWARNDIKELVDNGIINGDNGGLNLNIDIIRMLIIMKRMMNK